jgi:hypothetical protein
MYINTTKKWTLSAFAVVLFIGIGIWTHCHKYTPGKITFQEYTPQYLPASLRITNKTIEAVTTPSRSPSRYTVLHLSLTDRSYIYEQGNDQHFSNRCPTGKITNQTCSEYVSPLSQHYTLTTTTIPGQPVQQLIKWTKGNTLLIVNLSAQSGYPLTTITKFIDSFEPIPLQNLPINTIDNSTI